MKIASHVVSFLAGALLVASVACSGGPSKYYMQGLDDAWKILKPYTVSGIEKADNLDQEQKQIRFGLVDDFTRNLEEGLKNAAN